jgi:hypothetical protein
MAATMTLLHHRVHVRALSIIAAAGFGVLAAFQFAIALGAPFGRASWGGSHPAELPIEFRIASGVAVGVYVFAALIILARGSRDRAPLRWGSAAGGLDHRRAHRGWFAHELRLAERLGALPVGSLRFGPHRPVFPGGQGWPRAFE